MSDKVFLGDLMAQIETAPALEPVSKIVLMVDDDNAYVAGDDTGRTMTVTCPYGNQEMANNILAALSAYTYRPVQATEALLDPAAELGDGLTAGGAYTVLAQMDLTFDALMTSDAGAPGSVEQESELKYQSPVIAQLNYKIAQTRSEISKTAEEINLKITGLEDDYTELSVTLDGVTIKDASGQTLIKGSSIDTSTIKANSITADKLNLTGAITFGDLSTALQNDINDAYSMAEDAQDVVGGWTYRGTTYIDGSKIMAGTVMASILQGGTVELLDRNEDVSGSISIQPASTSDEAIRFESEGGMALDAMGGTLYLESRGRIMLNPGTEVECQGDFLPGRDDRFPLGASSARWTDVYAVNGTIQTSDANQKNSIEPLPAQYVTMLDQITPKRYKLNDGQSGRYHVGFIAQDVEAAMAAAGITDMEFAGWIKDMDADGNEVYMLRYNEFMAILLAKVKELEQKLTILEGTA